MTDSSVAGNGSPAVARRVQWAATLRGWLAVLNAFLERAFRTADVETGC